MHCRNCGELLDRRLREESQQFCYARVDESPRRKNEHPRMNDDIHFAYEELRALVTDLLAAKQPVARRQLQIALRRHLQAHCLRCGRLLDAAGRADPREDLCFLCQAELIPPPPGDPRRPDNDVPF